MSLYITFLNEKCNRAKVACLNVWLFHTHSQSKKKKARPLPDNTRY